MTAATYTPAFAPLFGQMPDFFQEDADTLHS
ncbi:hypothetical protein NONI108955_17180 [Nocardia ninae]